MTPASLKAPLRGDARWGLHFAGPTAYHAHPLFE